MKKRFITGCLAALLCAGLAMPSAVHADRITAQAAAVKITSKTTVNVGKTQTLKLLNPGKWKITAASSSNKAVCRITKTTAKTVKIRGIQKGTAKLTIRLKNSATKKTKKLFSTVSVKRSSTGQAQASSTFTTAAEAVSNMGTGWNIGNALDSNSEGFTGTPKEWEVSWGSSVITRELIQAMKTAGFRSIRVPVSWTYHMDADGNVDSAWMDRVEEVVNYCLDEGMYTILNVHHDCGGAETAWLRADKSNYDAMSAKYKKLWTQIANRFKKYNNLLLFEGYNELLDGEFHWTSTGAEGYEVQNALAQLFVDTVRATGGNNAQRNLIVNTYSADSGYTSVSNFILPKDTAKNHLAVQVHCYMPGDFIGADGEKTEFDDSAKAEIDETFTRLDKYFVSKGVPVIVGEYGAQAKNKGNNDEERAKYAHYFVSNARKYQIACFWWDDNGGMAIIDRKDCFWEQPGIRNAIVAAAEGRSTYQYEAVSQEEWNKRDGFTEEEINGDRIDMAGWTVSMYQSEQEGQEGNLTDNNTSTRWANGEAQLPNTDKQWIMVDMKETHEINRIMLYTNSGDYTRAYKVSVSQDGENWVQVAEGKGQEGYTNIDFDTVSARYFKINQTGEAAANYWSIYELRAYKLNK